MLPPPARPPPVFARFPAAWHACAARRNLPTAGRSLAGAAGPHGVVLFPAVPYGDGAGRRQLDVYVSSAIHSGLKGRAPPPWDAPPTASARGASSAGGSDGAEGAGAPVAFFVHGGVWSSGERSHSAPLATRLAQSGVVVVVISYSLWPDAMAWDMVGEVAQALHWTLSNVHKYGGDPHQVGAGARVKRGNTRGGGGVGGRIGDRGLPAPPSEKRRRTRRRDRRLSPPRTGFARPLFSRPTSAARRRSAAWVIPRART